MPFNIIKKVWDYCSYNIWFLLFIFILLFISEIIQDYVRIMVHPVLWSLIQIVIFTLMSGYGMLITRDRIRHGVRLPKIIFKDVIFLGVKATIVYALYLWVQGRFLDFVCSPLDFPMFDLESMLFNWHDTIRMLFYHNPIKTLIFLVLGAVIFYSMSFFMEIALARLADTRSILQAFNFVAIKRNIDLLGWENYAKEYTVIVVSIVILLYLQSFQLPHQMIDNLVDIFLGFLIFTTQYLGIGAAYCKVKDIESGRI